MAIFAEVSMVSRFESTMAILKDETGDFVSNKFWSDAKHTQPHFSNCYADNDDRENACESLLAMLEECMASMLTENVISIISSRVSDSIATMQENDRQQRDIDPLQAEQEFDAYIESNESVGQLDDKMAMYMNEY